MAAVLARWLNPSVASWSGPGECVVDGRWRCCCSTMFSIERTAVGLVSRLSVSFASFRFLFLFLFSSFLSLHYRPRLSVCLLFSLPLFLPLSLLFARLVVIISDAAGVLGVVGRCERVDLFPTGEGWVGRKLEGSL